ncbi:MAG: HepT-like ribonuclease domain-containing protein [Cyanobacterium sp.]
MNRDNASLLDIYNAIHRIVLFSKDLTKSDLKTNEEKQSAILYQVIIIGEAVKRLSTDFRSNNSTVPWKEIAGMRDILAHQYDRINIDTLWDVVNRDIPELKTMISPLLSDLMDTT